MENKLPISAKFSICLSLSLIITTSKLKGGFEPSANFAFSPLYICTFFYLISNLKQLFGKLGHRINIDEGIQKEELDEIILWEKLELLDIGYKTFLIIWSIGFYISICEFIDLFCNN